MASSSKSCATCSITLRHAERWLLWGLGGIGKTQIALQFAYQVREETPKCSIFWLPAISREGLEQVYTEIVRELKLPGWEDEGADSKALLQRHLSGKSGGPWLLIFDDADDIKMWTSIDGQQKRAVELLNKLTSSPWLLYRRLLISIRIK